MGRFADKDYWYHDPTREVVEYCIVPLIAFLGLVWNITTLFDSARFREKKPIQKYLTVLAVSESIFLLSIFPLTFETYLVGTSQVSHAYCACQPYLIYVNNLSSMISRWTAVELSWARLEAARRPIEQCGSKKGWKAIRITVLVFLGLLSPAIFITHRQSLEHCSNNTVLSVLRFIATEIWQNNEVASKVGCSTLVIILLGLPFPILFCLSCLIPFVVYRGNHDHPDFHLDGANRRRRRSQDRKVIWKSVKVAACCIFFDLPSGLVLLFQCFIVFEDPTLRSVAAMSNAFQCVHAALHVWLYAAEDDAAKQALGMMLWACTTRHQSIDQPVDAPQIQLPQRRLSGEVSASVSRCPSPRPPISEIPPAN